MPVIQTRASMPLVQVEDFPKAARRTVKGAIHLKPRTTYTLTDDEVAHLLKRTDTGRHIIVLNASAPQTAPQSHPVEAKPQAETEEPSGGVRKHKKSAD